MPKVAGVSNFTARLREGAGPKAALVVNAKLFEAGQLIATDAAHSLAEGSISGAGHVASAPGSAPNSDTRVLENSIQAINPNPLHVEVEASAINGDYNYAQIEFGNSRVAARPYMAPALQRNRKRATELVAEGVNLANRVKR